MRSLWQGVSLHLQMQSGEMGEHKVAVGVSGYRISIRVPSGKPGAFLLDWKLRFLN